MKKSYIIITLTLIYMTHINAQNPDYLYMIEHAVKAPSGHNTQPWFFKINEDNIQIHPNYDKTLPVVDPYNRELFISLGCATENLCITATQKGYKTNLQISEDVIITINLIKDKSVYPDTLFNQISLRQTNRSIYNAHIISPDTISQLKNIFQESQINVYFYQNNKPQFNTIANYIIKGNQIQMQDKAFTDELKTWMRYNKKHSQQTKDGLSYAVFGAPNLPMFIVKPIMSKALNEKSQNKGDKKKIQSTSHFVLLTTNSNTISEWIQLGIIMERFLLKTTELGIVHAYMNQPNEIPELSTQMAEELNLSNQYPAILLRIGYGEKMPYSKRTDIKTVILNQ